jgi:hypothetical protein
MAALSSASSAFVQLRCAPAPDRTPCARRRRRGHLLQRCPQHFQPPLSFYAFRRQIDPPAPVGGGGGGGGGGARRREADFQLVPGQVRRRGGRAAASAPGRARLGPGPPGDSDGGIHVPSAAVALG